MPDASRREKWASPPLSAAAVAAVAAAAPARCVCEHCNWQQCFSKMLRFVTRCIISPRTEVGPPKKQKKAKYFLKNYKKSTFWQDFRSKTIKKKKKKKTSCVKAKMQYFYMMLKMEAQVFYGHFHTTHKDQGCKLIFQEKLVKAYNFGFHNKKP